MGTRPSGVAEVAVVGLLDTGWQLNVEWGSSVAGVSGVPRTVIGCRARERNGRVPGSSLDPSDDQVGSTEIWRPHLFANF